MSDVRLREQERRWRASGSVEDGAAWLRERMRAGEVESVALELAAYVGHAPSCVALGCPAAPLDPLEGWVAGLTRFGPDVVARAAIAAVRATLVPEAEERRPHEALSAVQAWLDSADDRGRREHARVVHQAEQDLQALLNDCERLARKAPAKRRRDAASEGARAAAAWQLACLPGSGNPPHRATHAIHWSAVALQGPPSSADAARSMASQLWSGELPATTSAGVAAVVAVVRGALVELAIPRPEDSAESTDPDMDRLLMRSLITRAPSRLELAAVLGHAPAREILGGAAPPVLTDLRALLPYLVRAGRQALVRAVVAGLEPIERIERAEQAGEALGPLLDRARRWIECPCEACLRCVALERERHDERRDMTRSALLVAGCVEARDETTTRRYAAAAVCWAVLRSAAADRALANAEATCRALEASVPLGTNQRAAPGPLKDLGVREVDDLFRLDGGSPAASRIWDAIRVGLLGWACRVGG